MNQTRLNINTQEDTDLVRIINLFTRNYKVYIISLVIFLILAFFLTRFSAPVYRISASLMILEDDRPQSRDAEEFINNELFGLNRGFQNELYVLKSTPVIEQAVRNLDLSVNYFEKDGFRYLDAYNAIPIKVLPLKDHVQPVGVRFMVSIHDSKSFKIKAEGKDVLFTTLDTEEDAFQKEDWAIEQTGKFGKLIETPEFALIIELDSNYTSYIKDEYLYCFEFYSVFDMTGRLKNQVEFNIVDNDATVIGIDINTSSYYKGIDIVNELMDVYSTQNVNRKNHIANVTIEYIERQLSEISDSLSQTEDNLQQFRSSRQLIDVTDQATGMSEQYMTLQNQMAELVTRKRYYDYLAGKISGENDFSDMIVPAAMGIQDGLLNNLVAELITAQTQRSNLIENRQEKNPLVQRLEIQINNTKKTISENIAAVSKTTEIQIDEMNKRINRIRSEISRVPFTQRQLGGIERTYRLNDAIFNYLLEKRAEAKISQASNLPDNIIIEPANLADIVSPNPRKNYLIAFALGIILPFLFFFLRSIFNEKIEYQGRIDNLTDALLLGKIPHNRKKTNNVLFEHPTSTIAEAYRALRTNIEYRFKEIPHKVILVSSSIEGEGKSFNALNIAMSYAQLGRKTILVDFDLRKPTGYFTGNVISPIGLSSYLMDKVSIPEIIQRTPHDKLDFIPSGPIPSNPIEMMSTENIREIIDYLKEQYDFIIIDTTPLAQVSDAYLLMDYADLRIIVARYSYTLKKIFHLIMNDLKEKNIDNVCVVLNDNKVYRDQFGYGYGYEHKKRGWFKK